MRVEAIDDPIRFRELVVPTLVSDPVRHIAMLSLVDWRAGPGQDAALSDLLLAVYDGGVVVGAVLSVGGVAHLGELRDDLVLPVARSFAELAPGLTAVEGAPSVAEAFGRHWHHLVGARSRQTVVKRLHKLGQLVPHQAPGEARPATMDDQDQCIRWFGDFAVECGDPPRDHAPGVIRAIKAGRRWLWLDDAQPVSMAGVFASIAGVARVGPVYTPPDARGRGYGGALTAHISQLVLDRGEQACLYSDLANRTSTELYVRLGYEPDSDLIRLELTPAPVV